MSVGDVFATEFFVGNIFSMEILLLIFDGKLIGIFEAVKMEGMLEAGLKWRGCCLFIQVRIRSLLQKNLAWLHGKSNTLMTFLG